LKDDYARTQEEIAQAVGKSRSAVANTFRLLELSEPMQQAISEGKITPGHARALLMVDAADREKLFDRVIKSGLSVRQAEKIAKDVTLGRKVEKIARKYHAMESESQVAGIVKDMERTLESSLGRKVKIERKSNGSGKITVEFYSDRDLESLVEGIRAKN
jgi:ParB family chromosome partitioning protein